MRKFLLTADVVITHNYKVYNYEIDEDEIQEFCSINNYDKKEVLENIQEYISAIVSFLDGEYSIEHVAYTNYDFDFDVYHGSIIEKMEEK